MKANAIEQIWHERRKDEMLATNWVFLPRAEVMESILENIADFSSRLALEECRAIDQMVLGSSNLEFFEADDRVMEITDEENAPSWNKVVSLSVLELRILVMRFWCRLYGRYQSTCLI